ncbi:MAG: sigma-70 family RNA polymerase sigma factor [Sedimenticola sp.]|nr:sigma-70 family RNA polymerase sigma factor [Sedimenticola sp.]
MTAIEHQLSGQAGDLREFSDEDCVVLLKEGNSSAFAELMRRYQSRVYSYVLRMVSCPDDAMDICQTTFISAYRNLEKWQPNALFRTWLFRIASNSAIDYLRRNKLYTQVSLESVDGTLTGGMDPEHQYVSSARCSGMINLIQQLPPLFRQALLLRELEGMSYAEIAQALDVSEGTVKSRIARARYGLVSGLDQMDGVESVR